jgi:hypothetical protein
MFVLHIAGFHIDPTSRARHDRVRLLLSTAGINYTECTVNRAGSSLPEGTELPQLCVQEESGALRALGGMESIDRLNDAGTLRAECEAFKAGKRLEYDARKGERARDELGALAAQGRALEAHVRARVPAVRAREAELACSRRAAADAVCMSQQLAVETETLEKSVERLESRLAQASRALEAALALIGTLPGLLDRP